jgi:hypothetical protein
MVHVSVSNQPGCVAGHSSACSLMLRIKTVELYLQSPITFHSVMIEHRDNLALHSFFVRFYSTTPSVSQSIWRSVPLIQKTCILTYQKIDILNIINNILWHVNPLLGCATGVAQQRVARLPTGKQDSAQARWSHTSGVRECHVCLRGCQETSRHPVSLQREWGTWRNSTVERPVRPVLGYR